MTGQMDTSLYICAINRHRLSDNPDSVKNIIRSVETIYYENYNNFIYLMDAFGIDLAGKNAQLWNEADAISKLGSVPIVLLSDDGYAGFCDPGWELIQIARKQDINIYIIPQVSAPISAVLLSGYLSDENYHSFYFGGLIHDKIMSESFVSGMSAAKSSCSVFLATHPDDDQGLTERLFKQIYGNSREVTMCFDIGRPSQKIITSTVESFYGIAKVFKPYDYITYVISPENVDSL